MIVKTLRLSSILLFLCLLITNGTIHAQSNHAQSKAITNNDIILMTQADLSENLIIRKIKNSTANFRTEPRDLVDLKTAGVSESIIRLMMDIQTKMRKTAKPISNVNTSNPTLPVPAKKKSDNQRPKNQNTSSVVPKSKTRPINTSRDLLIRRAALRKAKTIAILKHSIYPKRQEIEKHLLKRKEWKKLGLSLIDNYKLADLYIEIDNIPLTIISVRYVYRVYDKKSAIIISAGETTAWGGLARNLAKKITKGLYKVQTGTK